MKATFAALLVLLSVPSAWSQSLAPIGAVGMPTVPPQPGGARFYNPAAVPNSPPVAGFYDRDPGVTILPQSATPSVISGMPAAPALPNGARIFGPVNVINEVPGTGARLQETPQPLPEAHAGAPNSTLPAPRALPGGSNFTMPAPPLPPMTTPVVVQEQLPPLPDYPMAEPFLATNQFGSVLPAMGEWGPGIETRRGPHLWFSADYLLWFLKNGPMPQPLLVTGPPTDEFPGALDQPNTTILYGGQSINYYPFSGARLSMGLWGGPDHRFGFEMGGFILEQKSTHFAASGGATGTPYLARPFINAQTGFENVYFVSQNFADPERSALMTGSVSFSNTSRLWSWETNGLWNVWRGTSTTANLIGGFRSVGLRERFNVLESLTNVQEGGGVFFGGASVSPGNTVSTFDKFDAENTFYGGQLGARFLIQQGRFSLNLTAKAALGVVQQLVVVDGGTILRSGEVAVDGRGTVLGAATGGVLAQSTNIGRHFQSKFSVVPEGAADFCFNVTDRLVVKLGYSFLYMSGVARPGDQIDRTINPAVVPTDFDFGTGGPSRPTYQNKTTDVWAHGANVGVEFRY